MEIRVCWHTTTLHLFLETSPFRQFVKCHRLSWVLRLLFVLIGFLACSIFLYTTEVLIQRTCTSYGNCRNVSNEEISLSGRKYSNDHTRTSGLVWDYSDPILLDVPPDIVRTTETSTIHIQERELSFGVVIDCGSSGSRVFVYFWPKHSGHPDELLRIRQLTHKGKPVVLKISPGIATCSNKPYNIKSYLKPLLDYASTNIPAEKHRETPLYVLCTAGMRMLSKRLRTSILEQVQLTIQSDTNFEFYPSHAEVISGRTEGLYFWMGMNYALGNLQQIGHPLTHATESFAEGSIAHEPLHRPSTVGVIDMGGGSLQIAFEVDRETMMNFSKRVLEIDLGCDEHKSDHDYKVFIDSFLHKGGNAVRSAYERDIVYNFTALSKTVSSYVIQDPCLPIGFVQQLKNSVKDSENEVLTLNGTGDFHLCKRQILRYLDKKDCEKNDKSCVLDGRRMPDINYDRDRYIGSSEFFYCMDDVLRIGGIYDKSQYEMKAEEYCATLWTVTWSKYLNGYYKYADANRIKFQCFKSAWVSAVLHEGLNFPSNYRHFKSIKFISDSEIQWTLGAILYKTRFLPLHEIQLQYLQAKNEEKRQGHRGSLYYPFMLMSHYPAFLFVCIGIAVLYVLISIIRFLLHMDRRKAASLRRVGSSVAYFVHEEV